MTGFGYGLKIDCEKFIQAASPFCLNQLFELANNFIHYSKRFIFHPHKMCSFTTRCAKSN